jgi:hypothetical protein
MKPKGSPTSRIWCVIDKPYEKDNEKGILFSSPTGFVFDKLWRGSGINHEPYICSLEMYPTFGDFVSELTKYAPPIICPLGKIATGKLLPETLKKGDTDEASLEKYAGSLLRCSAINYPHYCIPLLSPDAVIANWEYKFVHQQIDCGHVREELEYFLRTGSLQELPKREIITEPNYAVLTDTLRSFENARFLSTDIETIRPRKGSLFYGRHPGHMYLMGLANSPSFAISFCLWRYEDWQTVEIFRLLNYLFKKVPQIGQNYFTFDTHFTEAYGLEHCLDKCEDTMLRHQILWPELPHKLQFLTKQYTRQPYYKDEGKGWNPKALQRYMIYNGLDCCVTYEVYLGQEEEFNDRPYLR